MLIQFQQQAQQDGKPEEGRTSFTDKGKWNFKTPNYGIGSNIGQTGNGWTISVKETTSDSYIKLFYNSLTTPPGSTSETGDLGRKGYQYKNSLFDPGCRAPRPKMC